MPEIPGTPPPVSGTPEAEAPPPPTSGYGAQYPYGNVQALIAELAEAGTPIEFLLEAASQGGSQLLNLITNTLGSVVSNLLNMIQTNGGGGGGPECDFWKAYNQFYQLTQDNASNPIVKAIDSAGQKLGWSSEQTQDVTNKVLGGVNKIFDSLNSALNQLDPIFWKVDPTAEANGQTFSQFMEQWWTVSGPNNTQSVLTQMSEVIYQAMQDPTAPGSASTIADWQNCISDLGQLEGQVSSSLSGQLTAEIKLFSGELSTLVKTASSMWQLLEKEFQSIEQSMPGAGGG